MPFIDVVPIVVVQEGLVLGFIALVLHGKTIDLFLEIDFQNASTLESIRSFPTFSLLVL